MEFKLEIYTIDPTDGAYTKQDEIRNFKDLTFYSVKNGAGLMGFDLSGFSKKATGANLRRYITIVALKMNNTFLWTGFIDRDSPSYEGEDYNVKVECKEFFAHLYSRYTDDVVRFNQVDIGEIAWELIDYTQSLTNGQLGIIEGTIETIQDSDREYQKKSIGEAIIDLSNIIGGFDFTLSPVQTANGNLESHRFDIFASLGAYRPNVPALTLGGNVLSFSGFSRNEIFNDITYKGAGTGEENITANAASPTSQLAYTRRENVEVRDDISIQGTLQEHASRELQELEENTYFFDINMRPNSNVPFGSFAIGDLINVNLSSSKMQRTFVGIGEVEAIEASIDQQAVLSWTTRVKFIPD